MVKKCIKKMMQSDICNYCMSYMTHDINAEEVKFTDKDAELVHLFHRIDSTALQRIIILLLQNLQNFKM